MNRVRIDWAEVNDRLQGRCFICELQAGSDGFEHHLIGEFENAIAFLNKYPVVYGHVLVAPREHCEAVTGDFDLGKYLSLQAVVHRVAEAIRHELPTERLYILSLGSQQGNRHVHWHIVPVPPGVPYEEQQFKLLHRDDFLELPRSEAEALAARLRDRLTKI